MLIRIVLLSLFVPALVLAQWRTNGIPVCDTLVNRGFFMLPQIAPDGQGGAFVCWKDARNGRDYDVYAQRIGSDGRVLWQKDGIPIISAPATQEFPRIIADGTRKAFIAWEDNRPGDVYVYAQRIDNNGLPLWEPGGVRAAETPGIFISIALDSSGGVLLAWSHYTGLGQSDVYVQRLDSLGRRVWADSGIQMTNRPGAITANEITIMNDGQGGAIVAWSEGLYQYEKIYVQRIDSTGKSQWGSSGIEVSDSLRNIDVALSTDLQGGALVSWANLWTNLKYVHRIGPNGQKIWGSSPIVLGGIVTGGARRHTPDGLGGAFIGHSRWIQHVDKLGNKLWPGDGGAYTSQGTGNSNSTQVKNGGQGVYNFWTIEVPSAIMSEIYGQYIDSSGAPQWEPLGRPICSAALAQDDARGVSDGQGGAIIVWDDFRFAHSSIYAAKMNAGGIVTGIEGDLHTNDRESILLEQSFPNPFNPSTTIEYEVPASGSVQLVVYDVLGREVTTLVNQREEAGLHMVVWNGRSSHGQQVASGSYYYRIVFNGNSQITRKTILVR